MRRNKWWVKCYKFVDKCFQFKADRFIAVFTVKWWGSLTVRIYGSWPRLGVAAHNTEQGRDLRARSRYLCSSWNDRRLSVIVSVTTIRRIFIFLSQLNDLELAEWSVRLTGLKCWCGTLSVSPVTSLLSLSALSLCSEASPHLSISSLSNICHQSVHLPWPQDSLKLSSSMETTRIKLSLSILKRYWFVME